MADGTLSTRIPLGMRITPQFPQQSLTISRVRAFRRGDPRLAIPGAGSHYGPGSGYRHNGDSATTDIFNHERDLQAGYTKFIFQSVATGSWSIG